MIQEIEKSNIRRNEILDTARKFFSRKGYAQTRIQDIIGELDIAKGTFYHYFRSKVELLDAVVDRVTTEISFLLKEILESDNNVIEKFNKVFHDGTLFKVKNIETFSMLVNVLFTDENTVVREKMYKRMVQKNKPIFAAIIKQGIQEGLFNTPYPEDTAEMTLTMGKVLNEGVSRLLLKQDETMEHLVDIIAKKTKLYEDVLERILCAPKGSVRVYLPDDFAQMIRFIRKNM